MGLTRRFALIGREKNTKKVKPGFLEQAHPWVKFSLKLPREPVSGFLGITPAHSNKFPLDFFPSIFRFSSPIVFSDPPIQ
jgi:hypothetical protein